MKNNIKSAIIVIVFINRKIIEDPHNTMNGFYKKKIFPVFLFIIRLKINIHIIKYKV